MIWEGEVVFLRARNPTTPKTALAVKLASAEKHIGACFHRDHSRNGRDGAEAGDTEEHREHRIHRDRWDEERGSSGK
jgi:hypothetical protein